MATISVQDLLQSNLPPGPSGFSGYSGASGQGSSGFSGPSGFSGFSGPSGFSGFSGSGVSGFSGSGVSGFSGSGVSGFSGFSGISGFSGFSGFSGISGFSGFSGSGVSGFSGFSGISGFSGFTGISGFSGFTGISGFSGFSGISGFTGYSGRSGALSPWALKTANYTAVNGDRIIADTTAGTFTITLPATPVTGDYVVITDGGDFSTTNLTVGRNGSTIAGITDDVLLDLARCTFEFIYNGNIGSQTWEVTATTGARGPAGTVTSTSTSISSNTLTIDLALGYTVFLVSLNANINTVTISNTPTNPSNIVSNFLIIFTADGTGRTISWPGSVRWAGGSPPTPSAIVGARDVYSFVTTDFGSTWLASIVGQNY